ncbi:hypothetical protein MVEN_00317300 [Mycena venus]|uniref:Uncharacterized protein n=1 Tax=Mycena venus TaxID=2733690 RepID=A0A8H6YTR3_9AGAR|nr:hypothetical protein MVEN_00317300 [Mycena venus]
MPRCPGWGTECAGGKGLSLHLKLTTNERCSAIFRAAEGHDHGLPSGHTEFAGHFFGDNYTAGDFPDDSDDELDEESDNDTVGEDHEGANHADLEGGYEAPRTLPVSMGDGDQDDPMPSPHDAAVRAPTHTARKIAEDKFHHKPIVVKFPGGRAGQPIPSPNTKNSEQTYGSALSGCSTSNPYAPFNSKMDWEVARWAKLRGSGSTAFTDLLHIDGVRYNTFDTILLQIIN